MSTHTPSGVLAAGWTITTGASSAARAAGSLGVALATGPGAATALGSGEPVAGASTEADGTGWAERTCGCGALSVAVPVRSGGGVAVGFRAGAGTDCAGVGAESMRYVAWVLPALGADPRTACDPDAPAGGVIVTVAVHDPPPLHPGRAWATVRPSQLKLTGPLQEGPNQLHDPGYDSVAATGAPGAPWLADNRNRTVVAASAGVAASRTVATPIKVTTTWRAVRTATY
jgi:hypothetical protein